MSALLFSPYQKQEKISALPVLFNIVFNNLPRTDDTERVRDWEGRLLILDGFISYLETITLKNKLTKVCNLSSGNYKTFWKKLKSK